MSVRHILALPLFAVILFVAVPAGAAEKVDLAVLGLSSDLTKAVKANLSLQQEKDHELLDEYRIRALHRTTPQEIKEALRPFGYYRAKVESSLDRRDHLWYARYRVDPGSRVRVRNIDIRITGPGSNDEAFRRWIASFPLKPDDPLLHQPYEEAKRDLLALAQNRGYFSAQWATHRIEVNIEALSADIELHFESGPRSVFGRVRFGDSELRDAYLQRFVPFKRGEPYLADEVLDLQRALANTDYFQRVDVIPRPEEGKENVVPVDVRMEMDARTRYTAGLGYGTDTGPRLTLGVRRRWVNDRGHRMGAQTMISQVRDTVGLRYEIPLARPTTDHLGITGDWVQETTDTSDRDTLEAGVEVSRQLGEWLRTVGFVYQSESFRIAGESDKAQMLVPVIGWQRVEAEDRIFPQRGWRIALGAKGAWREFNSSTDFVQGSFQGKRIIPVGNGRLIGRVHVGVSEVDNFDVLPVSLRFFAGGDSSVRGYAYQSLGPTNNQGQVIGGRNLLVGSIEYDHMLTERWGYAVFFDAGNAYNYERPALEEGAGFGVRLRLPFGLIRLDLASAITEPGNPWRLHLTIGPGL